LADRASVMPEKQWLEFKPVGTGFNKVIRVSYHGSTGIRSQ
jgi:hypothetical protein